MGERGRGREINRDSPGETNKHKRYSEKREGMKEREGERDMEKGENR